MKKIFFYTLVITSLFLISSAYSQVTFQLGGGVGYSLPTSDFGGTTVEYYNGTKYGMEPGFNLHAKARLGLLFINAFGEFGYTNFSNEGEIIPGNNASVKVSQKVLSIKVGPEFKFSIPLSPITPYLDAFVALNTFSGKVQFKSAPNGLPSDERDMESASRVGLGAGGGVLFSLGGLNLDLSVQYHLMNVAGKKFDGDFLKNQRIESYTFLNDDKDPSYSSNSDAHIISDSRSIGAFEIKLTALFGL